MRPLFALSAALLLAACASYGRGPWPTDAGALVFKESAHSVVETVDRLVARGPAHGADVRSLSAAAVETERYVAVSLPALEAPIIAAGPRAGVDLPTRMRVWEEDGAVYLSYQAPSTIARRAGVAPDSSMVDRLSAALDALSDEAAAP